MNDFREFLRQLGLVPGAIVPDGRWRRCATENRPRKRNGAYKLMPDGGMGFARDWAIHDAPVMWRSNERGEASIRAADPDAGARAFRAEMERKRRASEEARAFYAGCAPLRGSHPYLEAHGLSMRGCSGLRVDRDGWLVAPMMRRREIVSVQRIAPDGRKLFWADAPTGGTAYVIERSSATVTVICEGLATGLACYAAVPTARVIVLWTAGNLQRWEGEVSGFVVVAADNDYRTVERIGRNPGLDAARELATRIGCGVAVPESITGTDWCDWRVERLSERIEKRSSGSRETDAMAQRVVDAEMSRRLTREAAFITPERKAG